jgi:hypothetical protein
VPLAGGTKLGLTITAPPEATVTWDYASPSGGGRQVRNCSAADATLTVSRPDGVARSLEIPGRFAVEHGTPLV